jgi:hypothetical protein
MAIVRVHLVPDGPSPAHARARARLIRLFPGLEIRIGAAHDSRVATVIVAPHECDAPDPLFMTEREEVDVLELVLDDPSPAGRAHDGQEPEEALVRAAVAVLTRHQRLLDRRNERSRGRLFDAVLSRHAQLHDRALPLHRADLHHAHDAWQWTLRLSPQASLALQIAALFHDVERLRAEPVARVEHLAPDYQAFKDEHARIGASRMLDVLHGLVDSDVLERAAALIAGHERAPRDHEAGVLSDADALSFFSHNAWGFVRWFDDAHTRRKVAWTFARMSPEARGRLDALQLPSAIVRALAEMPIDASEVASDAASAAWDDDEMPTLIPGASTLPPASPRVRA